MSNHGPDNDAAQLRTEAADAASRLLEIARAARLKFVVFRRDGQQPGEAAPLARALWMGIPELASRAGIPIDRETEGYPSNIIPTDQTVRERLAVDLAGGRGFAQWLDGHITPEMRQMFSPTFRGENIADKAMDANAAMNAERRNDIFAHERLDGRVRDGREDHHMIRPDERDAAALETRLRLATAAFQMHRQGVGL